MVQENNSVMKNWNLKMKQTLKHNVKYMSDWQQGHYLEDFRLLFVT